MISNTSHTKLLQTNQCNADIKIDIEINGIY